MIVDGMKNLTDLQKKTNEKFKQKIIDKEDDVEEDIDIIRSRRAADSNKQKEYFIPEHQELNIHEERPYRKPKQSPAMQKSAQTGPQKQQKKKPEDEQKEMMKLVSSQFGEGFLELDFGDEPKPAEKKPAPSKPTPAPASIKKPDPQKFAAYEFHHDGPNSVPGQKKHTPNRRLLSTDNDFNFNFDNFENQYGSTTQQKPHPKPTETTHNPKQQKRRVDIFDEYPQEDPKTLPKTDHVDGFDQFNQYVASP